MSDRTTAPAPCSCAADDAVRPEDFGWVLREWVRLLRAWEGERRALAAARTPDERAWARWRLDEAAVDLWKFKDEVSTGFVWCLRHAAELRADDLKAALLPAVAQLVGEQTDPALAALRGRVAALEKRVEVLAEKLDDLVAVVLSNIPQRPA
jgi:hypothetical protein